MDWQKPSIANLRGLGSKANAHVLKEKQQKLDLNSVFAKTVPRLVPFIFLFPDFEIKML